AYWSSQCRLVGITGWCTEIHPVRRAMDRRSFAGVIVLRHLDKLVHTSHDSSFVRHVRSNHIEFCRTLGLRFEYRRFAACVNHFSRVLDLALGPSWTGAFYTYDGVFGGDWTTCSAARVSRDLAKRRSTTGAS